MVHLRVSLQRGRAQTSAEIGDAAKLVFSRPVLLQRGRAQTSAEISLSTHSILAHEPASTGPRSNERGDGLHSESTDKNRNASTGPRSNERGDQAGLFWLGIASLCFNGAALKRARRFVRRSSPRCAWPSFNGAALKRARRS